MTVTFIAKARSTGTFHLGFGPSAVNCNSRNSGIPVRVATEREINFSKSSSWCKKCFPNGKPSEEEIARRLAAFANAAGAA